MNANIVPLFGMGNHGKSRTASAQRHLNLYAELQPEGEKSLVVFYGTPGTTLRKSLGDTPLRGWIAVDTLYYVVHRGTLYSINNAGTATSLGTLNTTTGRVDMAYNGTLILIVDGTNGYTFTISGSTFAQIGDADFPNGARTCTWMDGQFVVDSGSGADQFYISPTGTAWDALDFATAESNPDGLVRVFADNGEVILAGENTTEFWGNVGAADFPFAAIKGATQEFGLAARWSLCKFNSGIAALMTTPGGQVQVMFIRGYVPKPISSQEVDSVINAYATVSDATAYSYMLGGHPMLQINFPSAAKSWLYDASSNLWTPLEYGLAGARHRGEMALDFLNKTIIADYSTGEIFNLSVDAYTDNGTAIAREIIGRHFFKGDDEVTVDRLYVDMETGVGVAGVPDGSTTKYLNLPGASTDYASTPDASPIDITGDIDLVVRAAADDWNVSVNQRTMISKSGSAGSGQAGYVFTVEGSGSASTAFLRIHWSADGTATNTVVSTSAITLANSVPTWLRVTMDVNNGAAGHDVTFYTSTNGSTWSQLGSVVTGAGTTSIFNSSAEMRIGQSPAIVNRFIGKIYQTRIYNGIAGTLAAAFDADDGVAGASTVLSSRTGETYTMSGAASIASQAAIATVGASPKAMLQISVDNGRTFGNELWTPMGALGKYMTRVVWRRLGMGLDFVVKIRVTDPVKFVLTYAAMEIEVD